MVGALETAKRAVLFVDDEPHVLDGIKRLLRKEPYEILLAHSGAEALTIMAERPIEQPVNVVVSDEKMPGMSGTAFLAKVVEQFPDTARIILTGHADLNSAIAAVNQGRIDAFLTKPCDDGELRRTIAQALEQQEAERRRMALTIRAAQIGQWEWDPNTKDIAWMGRFEDILGFTPSQKNGEFWSLFSTVHPDDRPVLVQTIHRCLEQDESCEIEHRIVLPDRSERWVSQLIEVLGTPEGQPSRIIGVVRDVTEHRRRDQELKTSVKRLRQIMNETVNALSVMAEKRDEYTAGHQERVALLVVEMARHLNLSKDTVEGLRVAAKLHDIGKFYVPTQFLSKPGRLNEAELEIIRAHPQVGYDILKAIPFPWPVAEIVLQHHEKLDGSGYPQELKGDEILFEARLLAVADVYEAMSSHRPYRPSLGKLAPLEELQAQSGIQFDSQAVEALNAVLAKGGGVMDGSSGPGNIMK